MASTGGKAPRGQSRASRLLRAVALTANLNSQQLQDQRSQQSDQSVQLDDSNRLDVTQRSPLDLPQRSYTTSGGSDQEFGGQVSALAEMESQRTREAKMRDTAEQFVGAPTGPGAEIPAPRGSSAPPPEAPEAPLEEPEDEADAARQLAAEQAISVYQQAQAEQTQAAEQEVQMADASQERQTAMMWRTINGVDFAMAPTFLSAVVLVWMINVQLVNKMIFHDYKTVGNISMAEAMLFADIDLNLCCLVLPSCFSCIFPLFGLVIIIYAFANLFGYGK